MLTVVHWKTLSDFDCSSDMNPDTGLLNASSDYSFYLNCSTGLLNVKGANYERFLILVHVCVIHYCYLYLTGSNDRSLNKNIAKNT